MDVTPIVAEYGLETAPRESLGNAGGFSGARFWRLASPAGPLCLRRWPREHPSPAQLVQIHALLEHVAAVGFSRVPVPRRTRRQASFVSYDGSLWELTPWLPGMADFAQRPSLERLQAALAALAEFHRAAKGFAVPPPRIGPSPGIAHRNRLLQGWLAGGIETLRRAIQPGFWQELEPLARQICHRVPQVAPAVAGLLSQAAPLETALQACIGDVWHEHLLFVEDRVSGLVDFGSVRVDSVVADVARLLGSMADGDPARWQAGLAAYQAIQPLSGHELLLVAAFDRSTALMAGLNWIEWVYRDKREFEARQAVFAKMQGCLRRLEGLSRGEFI